MIVKVCSTFVHGKQKFDLDLSILFVQFSTNTQEVEVEVEGRQFDPNFIFSLCNIF